MEAAGTNAFPDALVIARAIVEACRLFGEDPEAVAQGQSSRARHVALDALLAVYPEANRTHLARCLGHRDPRNGMGHLISARKARWWSDMAVDEVVGALVGDRYGERAA